MAVSKLNEQEWAKVRSHWEMDSRDGFAWIVKELNLPVSAPGVRKKADKEGWKKSEETSANAVAAKVSRNKVSEKPETRSQEKPETKAETTAVDEVIPFKTRETPLLDELDKDEPRQGLFVREYVKCLNGSLAARRAGYKENSPEVTAARLLSTDKIQACVRELRDELLRDIEADAKDVIQTLIYQLNADINEISQYRRVCCRACWGEGHQRQYTPLEYQDAKLKHDEKRARLLSRTEDVVDIGEFPSYELDWYDKRREPNPDCPECFGEGLGEVYFGDTRKLSKAAKALYGGVKVGKEGIELIVANREKVVDQLARVLGLYKDREINVNVTAVNVDALTVMFDARMTQANERQRKVDEERGNIIDVVPEAEGSGE